MIVVVSDVHLGYKKCNADDFLQFLDKCDSAKIDHLVLLGDIVDFWRRNNAKIVTENTEILAKLTNSNVKQIHYVVGNHDYYLLRLNERYKGNYPFSISRSLRLGEGGKKYYLIHGYEMEVLANLEPLSIEGYESVSEKMCFTEDVLGWFASYLWDILEKRGSIWKQIGIVKKPPDERKDIDKIYDLAISKAKYMLLGMKPDEILVYGHTHRPFINKAQTVVNTGSWVDEPESVLKKEFQNSYVEISDGRMELKYFR